MRLGHQISTCEVLLRFPLQGGDDRIFLDPHELAGLIEVVLTGGQELDADGQDIIILEVGTDFILVNFELSVHAGSYTTIIKDFTFHPLLMGDRVFFGCQHFAQWLITFSLGSQAERSAALAFFGLGLELALAR